MFCFVSMSMSMSVSGQVLTAGSTGSFIYDSDEGDIIGKKYYGGEIVWAGVYYENVNYWLRWGRQGYKSFGGVYATTNTGLSFNTADDNDGDGLSNLDEHNNNTDMNVADVAAAPVGLDVPITGPNGGPLLAHPHGGFFFDDNGNGQYDDGEGDLLPDTDDTSFLDDLKALLNGFQTT